MDAQQLDANIEKAITTPVHIPLMTLKRRAKAISSTPVETYRDPMPDPIPFDPPVVATQDQIKVWLADHIHHMDAPFAYLGDEPNTWNKDWNSPEYKDAPKVCMIGGMSYTSSEGNLAVPLVYSQLNHTRPNYVTERCFFPNSRAELKMFQEDKVSLFSLENKRPLKDFDLLGFSISYIMPYLHIAPILTMSGIAPYALDRKEEDPIVIVGGCMSFVCEILAGGRGGVFDIGFIGESEDGFEEVCDELMKHRAKGTPRREILLDMQRRFGDRGVYCPQFYEVEYDKVTHEIVRRVSLEEGIPETIKKAYVKNLDKGFVLTDPFMSYAGGMAMGHLEIARGCSSACVGEGTWLNTSRGLVQAKELRQGSPSKLCDHGTLGWDLSGLVVGDDRGGGKAVVLLDKGTKQAVKLKTYLGTELVATKDHVMRVISEDGSYSEKEVGSLSVGDVLPVQLGGWLGSEQVDLDEAWLAGYMVGDGHIGEKEVWVFSSDRKLDEVIAKRAITILGEPNSKGWSSTCDKVCYWRWTNKSSDLQLRWGKSVRANSRDKQVPEFIRVADVEGVKAFLTGLYEADGSNDKNDCKVLSTTSGLLAEQVQQLLILSGIVASKAGPYETVKGKKQPGHEYHDYGPRYHVTCLGSTTNAWEIELLSSDKGKRTQTRTGHYENQSGLMTRIYDKLVLEGKRPYISHLRKEGELTFHKATMALAMLGDCEERVELQELVARNQYHTQIIAIEDLDDQPVVDISIEDHHWFGANSFIVHNCNFCQEGFNYRPYRERSQKVAVPAMKELMHNVGSVDVVPASFTSSDHHEINSMIKELLETVTDRVNIISQRADAFGLDPTFAWLTGMGGSKTVSVGMEGISQRMRDIMTKAISEENLLRTCEFALRAGYKSVKLFMITNVPGTVDSDYEELLVFLDKVALLRDKYNPKCEIKLSFTPLFISAFTPFQWHKITVDDRTLTPWIKQIKAKGFGFRLGSGARFDEAYLSQTFHVGDRRITSIMVDDNREHAYFHFGTTPKGTVQRWEKYLAVKDLSFDFYFQEKHEDFNFSWDHIDNLTRKDALLSEYRRSRQAMGHLEPCINECYTCGACDTDIWKQRKGWAKAKKTDAESINIDEIKVIRRSGMVQRARMRVQVQESHRYVEKDHWRLQIRRACYKMGIPIDPKTISMASDQIKMMNWISGVDYVDLKLVEHVFDTDIFTSKEFNSYLHGMVVTEAKVYDDMKGMRTIQDLCLYELEVGKGLSFVQERIDWFLAQAVVTDPIPNDLPGRDGKVDRRVKSEFMKAHPTCGRIKRMGFKGVERVIVDMRSYVDDIWAMEQPDGKVKLRMLIRGELSPYDFIRLLVKVKWAAGIGAPAARLEFLLADDVGEQDSFLIPRCVESDRNIEQNLFGEAIHADYCLRFQPWDDIYGGTHRQTA